MRKLAAAVNSFFDDGYACFRAGRAAFLPPFGLPAGACAFRGQKSGFRRHGVRNCMLVVSP